MLRACMIDGFGWFEPADYRRSWLLFDDVHYVLPHEVKGPLGYADLAGRPEFTLAQPATDGDFLGALVESAQADAADPGFRRFVESHVPAKDRDYAALVLFSDAQLKAVVPPSRLLDPVFAIAFLVSKLLAYAVAADAVPIVGRRYAQRILRDKVDRWQAAEVDRRRPLVTPAQGLDYAALSAGLSLDFVSDPALRDLPWGRLEEFKERHGHLLARSQEALLAAAGQYRALGGGRDFDQRLYALRLSAARQREELDAEARAGWRSMGLESVTKAVAGAAALATALLVLRGGEVAAAPLLSSSLAAVVGGLGAAMSRHFGGRRDRSQPEGGLMYLFAAEEFLSPPTEAEAEEESAALATPPRSAGPPARLTGNVTPARSAVRERWELFLCHAGPDLALAESLYDLLSPHCPVFLDSRCIMYGEDWGRRISEAQRAAGATVVLVTANTAASYYQREEIAGALALARRPEGHRVLSLFVAENVDELDVPYGLRLRHGVVLRDLGELPQVAQAVLRTLRELGA